MATEQSWRGGTGVDSASVGLAHAAPPRRLLRMLASCSYPMSF